MRVLGSLCGGLRLLLGLLLGGLLVGLSSLCGWCRFLLGLGLGLLLLLRRLGWLRRGVGGHCGGVDGGGWRDEGKEWENKVKGRDLVRRQKATPLATGSDARDESSNEYCDKRRGNRA
jgi:hypothetical protein